MQQQQIPPSVLDQLRRSSDSHHRSMLVLVGDDAKESVPALHSIACKIRPPGTKPTVLWCYKNELGFTSNRKKRLKQVKKLQSRGLYDPDGAEDFDKFASSSKVRWCYYKDTERVLGQTFGFLVLQDFEGLTPNLLARTVETVEGGGCVVFLIKTMDSLKRLYSLVMDVHVKFATTNNKLVRPRFNERFILSLGSSAVGCCQVMDEEYHLLNVFHKNSYKHADGEDSSVLANAEKDQADLLDYIESKQPTADGIEASLVGLAKTVDQAKCISAFVEAVSSKTLNYTISLTASRGRGKSAALGIALACAAAYGYSNIFLTAPSPENLQTVFEFAVRALEALKFVEHRDFELVSASTSGGVQDSQVSASGNAMGTVVTDRKQPAAMQKNIVRINIFRTHRQTIQYIAPTNTQALAQAEMLVVDEAAAIPLPVVKKLLGPYLVLLSSTIDGYEGTGRSLSIKLFDELRTNEPKHRRVFKELSLRVPIRYADKDPVERWLNDLLCLDAKSPSLGKGTPHPRDCELFVVDRDSLFSKHKITEKFLRRVVGLMVASHYKNTPNDLQLLSDAPAHRLFVLLGPAKSAEAGGGGEDDDELPDVLCVAQVAFEGNIPGAFVKEQLSQGNRSSGDLLPWTISQQFQDDNFASLSGARVVRIAAHQDAFSMGYGSRMLELLERYFKGELGVGGDASGAQEFESAGNEEEAADDSSSSKKLKPRKKLNPLLVPAGDVPPPTILDYLGVSFGVTQKLFRFWDKAGFFPLYLRQTENMVTGEHTCMMIKPLGEELFKEFSLDFSRRLSRLLGGAFRAESTSMCLAMLLSGATKTGWGSVASSPDTLTKHDVVRLEAYSKNLVDHHLVTDLLPRIADKFFFGNSTKSGSTDNDDEGESSGKEISLSALQQALLVGLGFQMKTVDELAIEFNLPPTQLLAMMNKAVRKVATAVRKSTSEGNEDGFEGAVAKLSKVSTGTMVSVPKTKSASDDAPVESESSKKKPQKNFGRRPESKHKRSKKD